jgi:hypothetical protein
LDNFSAKKYASTFFLFQVPDDSFQNIFNLSFDSDDSNTKCVIGSKGLDFLSTLSHNSFNLNNNSYSVKNKNQSSCMESETSWKNGSQQDDLEQAFAKLFSSQKPSSSPQVNGGQCYDHNFRRF